MEAGIKFTTVDDYINACTPEAKKRMQKMRTTIKKAAPEAEELISYGMPAFKLHSMLVYYAAFKEHYSLFGAGANINDVFKEELKPYELSKGTIRFPMDTPVPVELVTAIVHYRVKQNLERAAAKAKPAKKAAKKAAKKTATTKK